MPGPHTSPLVPIGPPTSGAPLAPLPPAPVTDAATAGTAPAPSGSEQWLQGPDGAPARVSAEDAGYLLTQGYSPLDPQLAFRLDADRKHKGLLSALGAVGQGALETLAPVVGPAIEDATGLYPYAEQRSLKEAHKVAAGVGMGIGAVAPAILTVGASAPASAAGVSAGAAARVAVRASAPEVLGALGAKVAAGVETAAGGSALARITGAAASSATQAAAFAGTDWANRRVQGDPKATAEQLFHQGLGAVIFGAPLGALGGIMTKGASDHAANFVAELRDLEARGGLKATGAIQGLLTKWEKQVGPERLKAIGTLLGKEGGVGPFKTFEEMLELAETRFKGPAAADMEAILQRVQGQRGSWGSVQNLYTDILQDPLIQKWVRNPLDRKAVEQFFDDMGAVLEKYTARNPDGSIAYFERASPASLHELSQQFAAKSRGWLGSTDPNKSALASAFDHARFKTNELLEHHLEAVSQGQGGLAGEAAAAWKQAKFRYQAGLFLEDGATKGWNRTIGNNQISPLEVIGSATGAVTGHAPGAALVGAGVGLIRREGAALQNEGARRLADFVEKLQSQSGQRIAEGITRIFRGAGAEASALVAEARERHRITAENYATTSAQVFRMAQDPEHTAQRITQNFGPLVEENGPVALALQQTASQAAQHMAAQLPSSQRAAVLDHDYVPSHSELANANRHWLALHSPESVLNRIADGSFTKEDGDALAAVYPTSVTEMKAKVAEALAEALAAKQTIPKESRLGLSQFLGTELSSRSSGVTIASVQEAYARMAAKPQAHPKDVDFKSSNQFATATQARGARMDSSKA